MWDSQQSDTPLANPEHIIKKAKQQRNRQFIGIGVMAITVLILILFTTYYASIAWNNFTLGLSLMIASLTFRIILECITLYRKENRLVSLDNRAFQKYLKRPLQAKIKHQLYHYAYLFYGLYFWFYEVATLFQTRIFC